MTTKLQGTTDCESWEWENLCEDITLLMSRLQSDPYWYAEVENFGWRHLSGCKHFTAETGEELLRAILPDTSCVFSVTLRNNTLVINNAHHDAPMGGEIYTITPGEDDEPD